MPNPRSKQCGDPTCYRAYYAAAQRKYFAGIKERTGVRYEDRYKTERICPKCARPFQSRHGSTWCLDCGTARGRRAGNAAQAEAFAIKREARKQVVLAIGPLRVAETLAFRMARDRQARAAAGSRPNRAVWVGGICRRCDTAFVCLWTNDLPRFCSLRCSRATSKSIRRARAHGGEPVPYSRRAIFERDRWICQLCGKRVRRNAAVPDPKAPVVDHIVPLAAGPENGGVDAPWNVQCAHFLCNSIKRDLFTAPALF